MQKISKPVSFFRRYYFFLMGAFWFFAGIVIIFFDNKDWLGMGYTAFGIAYSVYGIVKRENTEEYIAWDRNKIEIVQLYNEPQTYTREQIGAIHFSENNLTIKSGAAAGTRVELKDYKPGDLERLKEELKINFHQKL